MRPALHKFFQKTEDKEILLNSFYKVNPDTKPDKDITRK